MKNNVLVKILSLSLSFCALLSLNTISTLAENTEETKNENVATYSTLKEAAFTDSIVYANSLANGITAHYIDETRDGYTVKNKNMSLDYYVSVAKNKQVASLKSASGKEYLAGTMNAYVKMTDGGVYYTSNSANNARINIYKHGYYYNDVHVLGQSFGGELPTNKTPFQQIRSLVRR